MKTRMRVLGMGLFLFSVLEARADGARAMEEVIGGVLDQMNSATCSMEEGEDESPLGLRERIALNLSPSVSVGLSGVLNLQISPEIEFVWERLE